jgi:hypothetical protein
VANTKHSHVTHDHACTQRKTAGEKWLRNTSLCACRHQNPCRKTSLAWSTTEMRIAIGALEPVVFPRESIRFHTGNGRRLSGRKHFFVLFSTLTRYTQYTTMHADQEEKTAGEKLLRIMLRINPSRYKKPPSHGWPS